MEKFTIEVSFVDLVDGIVTQLQSFQVSQTWECIMRNQTEFVLCQIQALHVPVRMTLLQKKNVSYSS